MWSCSVCCCIRNGWKGHLTLLQTYRIPVVYICGIKYYCVLHFRVLWLFNTFWGVFAKFRKATLNFIMSVRPHAINRHQLRILMKIDTRVFFENLFRKFTFHSNLTRITSTSHEDRYKCYIASRSFLLRMKNVSDKLYRKMKTQILCSLTFFENNMEKL